MAICKCPKCKSTKYEIKTVKQGSNLVFNRRCKSCGEYYLFEVDLLGNVKTENK